MAASTAEAAAPHRVVTSIRSSATSSAPRAPTTPIRSSSSTSSLPPIWSSPSTLRAEDDTLIIEFDTPRYLRVGFTGDSAPKATVTFRHEQQRRTGDFRQWDAGYKDDWRSRGTGNEWGRDIELWSDDVRGLDMGLVGDMLERGLREAFVKNMLVDSKPRKTVAVLPPGLPMPLLSQTLDTLFDRFQPPTVSLFSSPVAACVAAGVRSGLVVDLGWDETRVTSVYEYREVKTRRSVRGGRMLVEATHDVLVDALNLSTEDGQRAEGHGEQHTREHKLSFEECDEITNRMVWCKSRGDDATPKTTSLTKIPIRSTGSPKVVEISYERLAAPCETTYFAPGYHSSSFDDHELPIPLLVYLSLLCLPMDVRAICMDRFIFTGEGRKVLGLRARIFDEVKKLEDCLQWKPMQGQAVEDLEHTYANFRRRQDARANGQGAGAGSTKSSGEVSGEEVDGVWHDASDGVPEVDPVERQVQRSMKPEKIEQGILRAVESLGPWAGASLLSHLRIPAIAVIDKETWQQHGATGASKPGEVDIKPQRQSMGATGYMKATQSWTLGAWGAT